MAIEHKSAQEREEFDDWLSDKPYVPISNAETRAERLRMAREELAGG